jgi:hypothetical protein
MDMTKAAQALFVFVILVGLLLKFLFTGDI